MMNVYMPLGPGAAAFCTKMVDTCVFMARFCGYFYFILPSLSLAAWLLTGPHLTPFTVIFFFCETHIIWMFTF